MDFTKRPFMQNRTHYFGLVLVASTRVRFQHLVGFLGDLGAHVDQLGHDDDFHCVSPLVFLLGVVVWPCSLVPNEKKPLPTGGKAGATTAHTREERVFGEAAMTGHAIRSKREKPIVVMAAIDISGGLFLVVCLVEGTRADLAQLIHAQLRDFIAPGIDGLNRQAERFGDFSHAAELLDGVLCFHGHRLNHVLQNECKHVFK